MFVEWIQTYAFPLSLVVIGIVAAVALTVWVLAKRRDFDAGPQKGTAANPKKVRRENPPDPPDQQPGA
jgi:type II secretory pathway pseudopilin PulG